MSFKRRVIIVISIFLMILLGTISLVLFYKTSTMLNADANLLVNTKLDHVVDNIRSSIELDKERTKSISRDSVLINFLEGKSSKSVVAEHLKDIREKENTYYELIKEILLIDLDGKVISATTIKPLGIDLSEREYFKKAKLTSEIILSDALYAKTDKDPITVTVAPVFTENESVLLGYVALAVYSEKFAYEVENIKLGENGKCLIVDKNNNIISNNDELEQLGFDLKDKNFNIDIKGNNYFIAQKEIEVEGNSWTAVVMLPAQEVYKSSRELFKYISYIGIIALIISVFISTYLSDILVNPIVRLTSILKKLSVGNEKYNKTLVDELESLSANVLGTKTENVIEVTDLKEAIYSMKKYIQKGLIRIGEEDLDSYERYALLVSQEIHTPVQSLKSDIALLKEGGGGGKLDRQIEKISKQTSVIEKGLILSLDELRSLDYKKILIKNEITVDSMIKTLLKVSREFVNENKRIFSFVDETESLSAKVIVADMELIKRVWIGFLINAVNFTEANGEITYKVSVVDTHLRIELIDDGAGMELEDADNLYDNLYEQDNKANVGIFNMIIAKNVFDVHDFKIGIRSLKNHYTKVWFDINIDK